MKPQWQPDYATLETPVLREMLRHAVQEAWHDEDYKNRPALWAIKLRDIRYELKRRKHA